MPYNLNINSNSSDNSNTHQLPTNEKQIDKIHQVGSEYDPASGYWLPSDFSGQYQLPNYIELMAKTHQVRSGYGSSPDYGLLNQNGLRLGFRLSESDRYQLPSSIEQIGNYYQVGCEYESSSDYHLPSQFRPQLEPAHFLDKYQITRSTKEINRNNQVGNRYDSSLDQPSPHRTLQLNFKAVKRKPASVPSALACITIQGIQLNYKYNNVACKFTVDCVLDLKKIAEKQNNLWLFRDKLRLLIRRPRVFATFRPNGGAFVSGLFPPDEAEKICRRFARIIQRTGFNCHFRRFKIVNVGISTKLPFKLTDNIYSDLKGLNPSTGIKVIRCASKPGTSIKINRTINLTVHGNGAILFRGKSLADFESGLNKIYPYLWNARKTD
ncbi:TATA box-binding protein-like 2 [Artemia franciscana]|uniref:Uncharacterized protein n=1 Tax=Artemia franciscana TaxID=6661 RepID=A0AA88IET3_ARTSF|nr:hypothetical protein QYM36_008383 [Artemia franciscana]